MRTSLPFFPYHALTDGQFPTDPALVTPTDESKEIHRFMVHPSTGESPAGHHSVRFAFLASVLVLLFTATALSTAAQPSLPSEPTVPGLTLEQAIQTGLANNPAIRRAVYGIQDGDEQVRLAWAAVMPDVSSSIQYTRNIEIPVTFAPARIFDPTAPPDALVPLQFGTDNNWQGGFTVTQNLFKGEAIVGISTAELYRAAQQNAYRATSQQVVTQIRTAYYAVLLAAENYRVLETSIRRLEQLLAENEIRRRAGLADDYDVLRIRVQLGNQRPQLIAARNRIEQAHRQLNLLLGMDSEMRFDLSGNLLDYEIAMPSQADPANGNLARIDQLSGSMPAVEDSVSFELRGDVNVLQTQIALRDKQLTAFRSRYLPTLSATYNLAWTSAQPGNPSFFEDAVRFQTLGVNMSLPLFQGFQRMSDINRVKIEQNSLRTDLDETLDRARADLLDLLDELQRIYDSVAPRQLALEQAREGYRIATRRLETGVGSQLELTDAELQIREAEFQYVQLVHDYLSVRARLDFALGLVPLIDSAG